VPDRRRAGSALRDDLPLSLSRAETWGVHSRRGLPGLTEKPVYFLDTCGDHDSGYIREVAYLSADTDPVFAWQHQIEQNQVRGPQPNRLDDVCSTLIIVLTQVLCTTGHASGALNHSGDYT
jgi:hypothetical protein